MAYFSELKGKKVLVTGGSRGIGKNIAEGFAALRADTAITGRDKEALSSAVEELKSTHPCCYGFQADMQNVNNVYEMVDQAAAAMGGLDILVNNAGINIPKPAMEVTESDWDQIIDTTLSGLANT